MDKTDFGFHLITIQNVVKDFDGEKPSDIEDLARVIKQNLLPMLAYIGDKMYGGSDFEDANFG